MPYSKEDEAEIARIGAVVEAQRRLVDVMGRRPKRYIEIPRTFVLGASKLSAIVTVNFALYSFFAHGEDHGHLNREELGAYIYTYYATLLFGAIFEAALKLSPRREMQLLPYWNSILQFIDVLSIKVLLIFDGSCQEVYKPICSNYDGLVLALKILIAPAVFLSVVSAMMEFQKYNSFKRYVERNQLGPWTTNKYYHRFIRFSTAIDTGLSFASLVSYVGKYINIFNLLFYGGVSDAVAKVELVLKITFAILGLVVGGVVDKFFSKHFKVLFCANEFMQTLYMNMYSTTVAYVFSLIYFNPDYRSGIESIEKSTGVLWTTFIVFAVVLTVFLSGLRAHDEFMYKFLTKEQLQGSAVPSDGSPLVVNLPGDSDDESDALLRGVRRQSVGEKVSDCTNCLVSFFRRVRPRGGQSQRGDHGSLATRDSTVSLP